MKFFLESGAIADFDPDMEAGAAFDRPPVFFRETEMRAESLNDPGIGDVIEIEAAELVKTAYPRDT